MRVSSHPLRRVTWVVGVTAVVAALFSSGVASGAAPAAHQPLDQKVPALRAAIRDLIETFASQYPAGPEYLKRLQALEQEANRLEAAGPNDPSQRAQDRKRVSDAFVTLRRDALLANPLLDFDRLLLVVRPNTSPKLGLPHNWESNSSLAKKGFDDRIAVLDFADARSELATVFKPGSRFVGDVDPALRRPADALLDARRSRLLQIFEVGVDGAGLRQLTGEQPDVDCYDACYLPDGKILFTSTACFVGVPCVYGSSHVSVLYVMDADGKNIRQLCFDQEHDWCPVVTNNGRVMYSRWEYTDTPHSNTRLLFHMNPDGTGQMEYYGSNSYWPNSIFYADRFPDIPRR